MRIPLSFLAITLFLSAGCGGEESVPPLTSNEKSGQEAFRGCAVCHCVTDSRVPEDEDWIVLNRTTRCIKGGEGSQEIRRQIEAYLRAPGAPRPPLVNGEYRPGENIKTGMLKMPEMAGSAYLKAERTAILRGAPPKLRIAWEAGETLSVPVGSYRIISYIFRTDFSGKRWLMTGTGSVKGFGEVTVREKGSSSLLLSPSINGTLSFEEPEEGGILFRYALRDGLDATISLSTEGEVVCPYIVVLKGEEEVYRGVFENTCGKLSSFWESGKKGNFSSASVVFKTGPFSLKDAGPVRSGG